MDRYQWGTRKPGFLVFLIDQSGSMSVRNKHMQVAKAIQDAIMECYSSCIDGEYVKPRFAMSIIGYGDDVEEMWSGWINNEQFNDKLMDANDNDTSFFPAKASGNTPMAEAFDLAYDKIQTWVKEQGEMKKKEQIDAIPAPIVINITDGFPDTESSAASAAQRVMELQADDGKVIVFNMHIADSGKELLFPMSEADLDGSRESRFLFNISTPMDEQMVRVAYANGFENVKAGARGMIANAKSETIAKFISFGSATSLT